MLSMRSHLVLGISLPRQIIGQIDSERGDVPRSRYMLRILEKRYTQERKKVNQGSLDHEFETLGSSKPLRP
jgi:hypothetical protein